MLPRPDEFPITLFRGFSDHPSLLLHWVEAMWADDSPLHKSLLVHVQDELK